TGEDPFHAFLGVPVMHHGKVLGVLVVQQREMRRFDQSEEAFLVTISAQLSAVVAHARATGGLAAVDAGSGPQPAFFDGLAGANGAGIGLAVLLYPPADPSAVPDRQTSDIHADIALPDRPLAQALPEVRVLAERGSQHL